MRAARLLSTVLSVALVLDYAIAHGAEMTPCHSYANRASAEALRRLLGMAFVDIAVGRFMYRKSYTFCLLQDEVPEMTFTAEEQPIVDGAIPTPAQRPEPLPGSVPATDQVEAAPPSPDLNALYKKCARAHPQGYRASDHTFTKLTRGKWLRVPCT